MFGAVSEWFLRSLGGINAAEDAFGFDKIIIRPQIPKGLQWVKTSYESVRGRIQSNWEVRGNITYFEIEIPGEFK